jgi:hypothetical protein
MAAFVRGYLLVFVHTSAGSICYVFSSLSIFSITTEANIPFHSVE